MSKRWIHVTTVLHPHGTPNVPLKRNNGKYDITIQDELVDPNVDSGSYGDDQPTKFLEAIINPKPPYDPITEQLVGDSSVDILGANVPGVYNSGSDNWQLTYSIVPNELENAKIGETTLLDDDLGVAMLQGYTVGNKILTLEPDQVNYHSNKIARIDHLVESGKITGTDDVSIQDSEGTIITVTASVYGTQMANYFDLVRRINDEYLIAQDAIIDAADLVTLDAITWDFQTIIATYG